MKTYKIRYNTVSQHDGERWRLVDEEDNESLVREVLVDVPSKTTKDWVEGVGEKFHITATGHLEVKEGAATISRGSDLYTED